MPIQPKLSKILPLIVPFTRRKGIDKINKVLREIATEFKQFLPHHQPMLVYSKVASNLSIFTSSSITQEQSTYLGNTHAIR